MHSLSTELLNTKAIHLTNWAIMSKKHEKLRKLNREDLIQVAIEVRNALGQPAITDVLTSDIVSKHELIADIFDVLNNSVNNGFKTIMSV